MATPDDLNALAIVDEHLMEDLRREYNRLMAANKVEDAAALREHMSSVNQLCNAEELAAAKSPLDSAK